MRTPRLPPADDLTARARIRDAAVTLFGENGYRGTSIRDVARLAGVSAGLVQHHFGSKEALRNTCDGHVLETLRVTTERKLARDDFDADFISALYDSAYPVLKYVARGLAEGWPGAARLFDLSVETNAKWLTKVWPERFPAGSAKLRRHAATMVSMNIGTIALHEHLGRWLGGDPLERGRQQQTGLAMLEIYSAMGEFLASSAGRNVRDATAEYDRRVSGGAGGGGDEAGDAAGGGT